LAYVQVNLPAGEGVVHITAIPTGFYINRSSSSGGGVVTFDPSPAAQPCFSHEILDCLLQKSSSLRIAWAEALSAVLERSKLDDNPLNALFLAATQSDLTVNSASASQKALDAVTLRSSWLVPCPKEKKDVSSAHAYNLMRSEDEMADTFGLVLRRVHLETGMKNYSLAKKCHEIPSVKGPIALEWFTRPCVILEMRL